MNKVIFWDSDGTLLYNNESFKCSLMRACETYGYFFSEDEIRQLMRRVCSWYVPEKDHSGKTGEQWWQDLLSDIRDFCVSKGIGEMDIAGIISLFRRGVVEYEYKAYDDAADVLKWFAGQGFSNYIISNNFPELDRVFERLGLGKYISGYITSAEAGYEKPDIRIYQYAVRMAGDPEVCYMVGDNPRTDYAGGKTAGMIPVLVHGDAPECEERCSSLSELKEMIK
ncbi:MAG: hypothetical protein CW338_06295 [Clostridiales bacterium]|nr:hypothetical protein [Clostridiales bacterium]